MKHIFMYVTEHGKQTFCHVKFYHFISSIILVKPKELVVVIRNSHDRKSKTASQLIKSNLITEAEKIDQVSLVVVVCFAVMASE